MVPVLIASVTFVVWTAWLVSRYQADKGRPPLPPGPPGDPVIGHLRILHPHYHWKTYVQWGKTYGERNVMYTNMFGWPQIILNSIVDAKELLEKRGANYSDRPRMMLLREVMGLRGLTFLPYRDRFRQNRRLIQQFFNPRASAQFRPAQKLQVMILLNHLLQAPEDFLRHIQRWASRTMLNVAYGHQVVDDDDPYAAVVERTNMLVSNSGNPGATLVDFIPILRFFPAWFPGARYMRHASEIKILNRRMVDETFELAKRNKAKGFGKQSLSSKYLDILEQHGECHGALEDDMKEMVASIYPAGVATQRASVTSFVLAMVHFPEVAARARKELDLVVGRDRLPDWSHRKSLPFLEWVLKENFRWNPVTALGIPHRAMEEDVYQGRRIPQGATVIANIWAMTHDESAFPDPFIFKPERYAEGDGKNAAFDPTDAVFGFGRRQCPGRFFADAGLWLAMACILANFDISPCLDDDGNAVLPSIEFSPVFTSNPLPFQCRITSRDEISAALVRRGIQDMVEGGFES
ncbi:cytochrome P450 [Rickenella mellea]|uniref:Cytochrome P450 n=1 Tax=Rickenella mellea TaxID=50990 RepID=A0A4Y7QIU7_9AGAM|nr:cytochrome P450 [Rickenella mellea]